MSRGVLVIIGFTSSQTANTIKTYTNFHHIPFISLSPPIIDYQPQNINDEIDDEQDFNIDFQDIESGLTQTELMTSTPIIKEEKIKKYEKDTEKSLENNYQINAQPDMVPLLISLVKYNRWKRVYYVYNHPEGKNHILLQKL
jgi:hypothetical protein